MKPALVVRPLNAAGWVFAVAACFALSSQAAFAYLDPVSTTFALQAIAGFAAALVAGVRSFRRRLLGFVKTGRFVDPDRNPRAQPDAAVAADDGFSPPASGRHR